MEACDLSPCRCEVIVSNYTMWRATFWYRESCSEKYYFLVFHMYWNLTVGYKSGDYARYRTLTSLLHCCLLMNPNKAKCPHPDLWRLLILLIINLWFEQLFLVKQKFLQHFVRIQINTAPKLKRSPADFTAASRRVLSKTKCTHPDLLRLSILLIDLWLEQFSMTKRGNLFKLHHCRCRLKTLIFSATIFYQHFTSN